MTDINTTHDCCSPAAKLPDANNPTSSNTILEVVHDCCSPAAKLSNMAVQLSATKQTTMVSGICPACGHKGKAVDGTTVKAMLAISLLAIQDTPYLFCREAACPVV